MASAAGFNTNEFVYGLGYNENDPAYDYQCQRVGPAVCTDWPYDPD